MGYQVEDKILHSANYGVPQKRERMIVIAVEEGLKEDRELHPKPTHYIPNEMRGISVKKGTRMLDTWLRPEKNGLKKYTTIEEAFEGLPLEAREGEIELPERYTSRYMDFIRMNGSVRTTTQHIAKEVRPADRYIAERIAEGKIYRSNRMGERYTPVWEVYAEKLTGEEQRVLEYLGRNETRKTLVLEKKLTTDGHLPEELVLKQTQTGLEVLQQLLKEGWITKKIIEGRIGYRLSTKAGHQVEDKIHMFFLLCKHLNISILILLLKYKRIV